MRNGRYCPLQQGMAPCTTACAWYDARHGCCELVNISETLLDISETLENFHAAQAEDSNDE